MKSLGGLKIPPQNNELEISLFGPGYGESVLVHLGDASWVLIDSCIAKETKLSAPLEYLKNLSPHTPELSLIVASHWHDDHIKGLSQALLKYPNAEFAMPAALSSLEFLQLTATLQNQASQSTSSGVKEMHQIVQLLKENKKQPKFISADSLIYANAGSQIFALSPSDIAKQKSLLEIADLIPNGGTIRRAISSSPNNFSVALLFQINGHSFILGSDLQEKPGFGWTCTLATQAIKSITKTASAFKVPHHGSENGHHDDVWQKLLAPDPIAILTEFRRGDTNLPTEEDKHRIRNFTKHLYCTGSSTSNPVFAYAAVERTIKEVTKEYSLIPLSDGQIRMRLNMDTKPSAWHVELFGTAYKI